jgi:hypothetical protein
MQNYGVEAIDYWIIFSMKTKSNQITDNFFGIWGHFLVLLESPRWIRFNRIRFNRVFISQFPELRCGRYWFLSGFCWWKFKQIAKKKKGGFERKNQQSPSNTWAKGTGVIVLEMMRQAKKNQQFCFYQLEGFVFVVCTVRVVVKGENVLTLAPL